MIPQLDSTMTDFALVSSGRSIFNPMQDISEGLSLQANLNVGISRHRVFWVKNARFTQIMAITNYGTTPVSVEQIIRLRMEINKGLP